MLGGGTYRYISGALNNTEVSGRLLAATILPGWRFVRGKFIATIYGGLDLQNHRLTPDDPTASSRGGYVGLRVNAEVWYEPTPTTMVAADAMVSTIGRSYNARAAFGWRVLERFYLGPEVQGFRRRRQLPPVPHRRPRHRAEVPMIRMVRLARLGHRQRRPRRALRQTRSADADVA